MDVRDVLIHCGYKLVDEAWEKHSRCTYLHDENADRAFFHMLQRELKPLGWRLDSSKLRTLVSESSRLLIEIEPGGSETSGHFLHLLAGQVAA
jgi:hypothetical protein